MYYYNKEKSLVFIKKIAFFAIISAFILAGNYVLASDHRCNYRENNPDCIYIECTCDTDCGSTGFFGDSFCQNGNVYRNYKTNVCLNPGTKSAECTYYEEPKLWYECESWQTCSGGYCINNYNELNVQTNSATNISAAQATLNGYLYTDNYSYNCNLYVWFEYGPNTSYGFQTNRQQKNYAGSFSQNVNLYGNYSNYHFRAVAEDCQGRVFYGQNLSFYVGSQQGYISVDKTARNLTSGTSFAKTIYASPSDTLMFMITLLATGNQSVNNIYVRDYLPNNLIYKDQLIVSGAANYGGDINSGINIGAISSGQTVTITYQAEVASAQNFSYGTTTLNNNVSVTGSGLEHLPSNNASVIVTRSGVLGATTIPTGLTNNFWLDSFFLPLAVVLLVLWLWRSGIFFGFEKWMADKRLMKKIAAIQKRET